MDHWYIWFEILENGKTRGKGMYHRAYKHKSSAVRRAKQMWGDELTSKTGTFIERIWIISQTNPWDSRYIFITRADAEKFVDELMRLCDWYGCCTVGDAKDLADKDCERYDNSYGWMSNHIGNTEIHSLGEYGYEVKLPRPLPIM